MRKAIAMVALLSAAAVADEHHHPAPVPNPTMDKLKSLVGSWEGTAKMDGKVLPTKTNFKLVSGGSVLMNTLDEGGAYEMVTMIHTDGKDVLATHYCAAANQPRFKAVPGKPNEIKFDFKDGTNLGPKDGHMQGVVFTFVDADHHYEDWIYLEGGKESTSRFDYHRKK